MAILDTGHNIINFIDMVDVVIAILFCHFGAADSLLWMAAYSWVVSFV